MHIGHHHHRFFIAIATVILLITGLLIGAFLSSKLEPIDLDAIIIGLTVTNIILLLIIGSLLLEVREAIRTKIMRKK